MLCDTRRINKPAIILLLAATNRDLQSERGKNRLLRAQFSHYREARYISAHTNDEPPCSLDHMPYYGVVYFVLAP